MSDPTVKPSPVSVRHADSPIAGHFILNDGERSQQHVVSQTDETGKLTEYVCIGFDHAAKIITALMVRYESPKNELDKACAWEGLEQICGLLGSLGVIVNLPKIRAELCADCLKLGAPGTDIINADVAGMADKHGASPGKSSVGGSA